MLTPWDAQAIPSVGTGLGGAARGSHDPPAHATLPSLPQLPLLEDKLQAELPAGARVVSGRFPLPTWQPVAVVGEGLDQVWAYDIHRGGPAGQAVPGPGSASVLGTPGSQTG